MWYIWSIDEWGDTMEENCSIQLNSVDDWQVELLVASK